MSCPYQPHETLTLQQPCRLVGYIDNHSQMCYDLIGKHYRTIDYGTAQNMLECARGRAAAMPL